MVYSFTCCRYDHFRYCIVFYWPVCSIYFSISWVKIIVRECWSFCHRNGFTNVLSTESVEPINDFTTNSNNTVTRLDVIKILIQIVVSLMILIIAVFMIFSPNGEGITKFWVALSGVVVGYWLK